MLTPAPPLVLLHLHNHASHESPGWIELPGWQVQSVVISALLPVQLLGLPRVILIDGDVEGLENLLEHLGRLLGGHDPIVVLSRPDRVVWDRCFSLGVHSVCAPDDRATLLSTLHQLSLSLRSPQGAWAKVQAVHRERHQLQSSLDNIPAPIFIKDAHGVYRGCNQAFEAYIGLKRDQILDKTVYDIAPAHLARIYEEADRTLLASGGRQVYDAQVRYADGELRDVTFHKGVFRDAFGQVAGQAGAIFDITERKRLERSLREMAEHDSLTGILNRGTFFSLGDQRVLHAAADKSDLAVIVMDVDHFKAINDTHGHATGDAVLQHLTQLIGSQLRENDLFARLGGEEFAVLLSESSDALAVAERLRAKVAETAYESPQGPIRYTLSLGVAYIQPHTTTLTQAVARADEALYAAKRAGRNGVREAQTTPS